IRGVPTRGSLQVVAWCDALGIGTMNFAADPVGSFSIANFTGAPAAGSNITLVDPTPQTPTTPQLQLAAPVDQGFLLSWNPARDGFGHEIADHYRIYVADSPNPGPANHVLVQTVVARALHLAPVRSLTNGTTYYIAIAGVNNGAEGPVSSALTAVAGATTGGS